MRFASSTASVLAAAITAVIASNAMADIKVQIGSTAKGLRDGSAEITLALTNDSQQTAYLPVWQTPLNGVLDDLFEVTLNGQEVPYTGVHAKWAVPSKEQMLEMDPGQTMFAKVSLANYYDMYQSGVYQVKMRVTTQSHPEVDRGYNKSGATFAEIASNEISLYAGGSGVSKIAELRAAMSNAPVGKAAAQFQNCTATRQSQLNTAFSSSKTYSANAVSYYANRTTANITARHVTWFGSATSSRISTARSHFNNINSALNNQQIVFNCSCDPQYANAYAYVNPGAPYVITLCGAFWPAPNTGTDSKAGTIIHEMSHFNVVAGTDDWAYGQSAAKSLAISNANKALDNADSHEYFSENTPAQN